MVPRLEESFSPQGLIISRGQTVDFLASPLFGHGNEYGVGQVGVPAAQGDAAVVAQAAYLREHGSRILRAADDELLEEWSGKSQREPGNGRQPVGGVVGLAGRQLGG